MRKKGRRQEGKLSVRGKDRFLLQNNLVNTYSKLKSKLAVSRSYVILQITLNPLLLEIALDDKAFLKNVSLDEIAKAAKIHLREGHAPLLKYLKENTDFLKHFTEDELVSFGKNNDKAAAMLIDYLEKQGGSEESLSQLARYEHECYHRASSIVDFEKMRDGVIRDTYKNALVKL